MSAPPQLPYPGPDINISGKLIGATVPLVILSTSLCSLRLYTRIRPILKLDWDDWTVSMAMVCVKLQWAFVLAAIPHGYGRHAYYLSLEDRRAAGLLLFSSQIPWSWGVSLSKISIAFMLLRIKHTVRWRIFLYTMIIIQVASSVSANIVQFSICRPLASFWDPSIPRNNCWPHHVARTCIIVNGVIAIATDIILTFTPLTLIYKIKRPLREKIVVSILMGLGILASAASVVKLTLANKYGGSRVDIYDGVDLTLWSIVEGEVAIIAACVPCLKVPAEKVLRRLGLLSSCEDPKYDGPKHLPEDRISPSKTAYDVDEVSLDSLALSERNILPPEGSTLPQA